MSEPAITKEEQAVIDGLHRLAKSWPKTLWLYSANGVLCVMKKNDEGEHAVISNGSMDSEYVVATIAIENDGGDW